jgi:hypothetical protein
MELGCEYFNWIDLSQYVILRHHTCCEGNSTAKFLVNVAEY